MEKICECTLITVELIGVSVSLCLLFTAYRHHRVVTRAGQGTMQAPRDGQQHYWTELSLSWNWLSKL